MFGKLIKTVLDTASIPVAVVRDVVTLNKDECTAKKIDDVVEDISTIFDD